MVKSVLPEDKRLAFRAALLRLLQEHAASLSAPETLALASHIVGELIAMQDQRTMTPKQAMDLVLRNIRQGNADIVGALSPAAGSA